MFGGWEEALAWQARNAPGPDAAEKELILLALDAVKSAGANYADVRITRGNSESISTRERQITGVGKSETYGIGIRALVGGSWGFAATRDLSRDAVVRTAREAAAIAAGNNKINPVKTTLAPVKKVADGRWITPHDEGALIRAGNSAAAIALGGALLGYVIPLASALTHTVSLPEFVAWAALAGVIQITTFWIIRLAALRDVSARIERGEIATGIYLAAISICVGVLNAACMSS